MSDVDSRLGTLEQRLGWLEAELASIRQRLAGVESARQPTPGAAKPARPPATGAMARPPLVDKPPATPAASTPPPLPPLKTPAPGVRSRQFVAGLSVDRAKRVNKAPSARSLERMIGERWAMIVGAIVVVIGVGLFFKWAYDVGWLQAIAPWLRCALGAMFGAVLVGVGEIARKRINDWAGAGFSAAGIGVMYTSAFAAHQVFALISPAAAFALLAGCVVLGIGVSVRARLASVGVVSLIAGYMTPILLAGSDSPAWFLPSYLIALLVVALSLSTWRGRRFALLRTTAWWGTALLGLLWSQSPMAGPVVGTVFFSIVWALVHAELIWSSRHVQRRLFDALDWHTTWGRARHLITTFATTIWAVGLALLVYGDAGAELWFVPLLACVGALGAIIASGGRLLTVVRTPVVTLTDELRVGLGVQAGALAVATIALLGVTWLEVGAWAALGLGAIIAARRLRADALGVYGVLVLLALLAKEIVLDAQVAHAPVVLAGLAVTRWSLQMAVVGVSLVIGAWWMRAMGAESEDRRSRAWRLVSAWSIAIGLTAGAAGLMTVDSLIAPMIAVGFVLALMVSIVGTFMGHLSVRIYALVVLGLSLMTIPATQWWDAQGALLAGVVFSSDMLLMVFGAIVCAAMSWLTWHARPVIRGLETVLHAIAAGLLMLGVMHVDAHSGAITLTWTGLAMGALALSWWRSDAWFDRIALGMLGAASLVWLGAYPVQGWSWIDAPALAHPGLIVLFFLTCAVVVTVRRIVRLGQAGAVALASSAAGILTAIVLLATSLEIARVAEMATADPTVRRAVMSLWWGLFAIGLISVGFWRRLSAVRYCGLALIGVAVVKALAFDLVGVSPGWRVLSVIGLGLLLLVIAGAYAKLAGRLALRAAHA